MEIVLIAAAVLPAAWLMIRVYRADRLEKEPVFLLLSLLVLGIIATGFAGIAENYGEAALSALFPEKGILYNIILYFIATPRRCKMLRSISFSGMLRSDCF